MVDIDTSTIIKDVEFIKSITYTKGDALYSKEPIYVIYPSRFEQLDMVEIKRDVTVLSIVGIFDKTLTKYSSLILPIKVTYSPMDIEKTIVDDAEYTVLSFDKGVIVDNLNLVIEAKLIYTFLDEPFVKGNVPFYITEDNLSTAFMHNKKLIKNDVGYNKAIIDMLVSMVARQESDPTKYYKENPIGKPYWISIQNPYLSYSSTGSKIIGSYMKDGTLGAMVDKNRKETNFERTIRQ